MRNRILTTISNAEFRSKFVSEEFLTEGRHQMDIPKARIAKMPIFPNAVEDDSEVIGATIVEYKNLIFIVQHPVW